MSVNWKSFGDARQANGLNVPGALLTLTILRLKSVPAPESGTKVSVAIRGVVARPDLPAWGATKAPVVPVSNPKEGR